MKKKRYGKCVYCCCDLTPETRTNDHVVPRGYLVPPLPDDLRTVPSCRLCNDAFGPIEERVRNIVVQSIPRWEERYGAVQSKGTRAVLDRPRRYPTHSQVLRTASGIWVPSRILRFAPGDLETVFYAKMTRALFYLIHGEPMGDVEHVVGLLNSVQADVAMRHLRPAYKLGSRNELMYSLAQIGDDVRSTQWFFLLYNAVGIGGWTGECVSAAPPAADFAQGVIVGGNPDAYAPDPTTDGG